MIGDGMTPLDRFREIEYHLRNIPPVLRNQATKETLDQVRNHISDMAKEAEAIAKNVGDKTECPHGIPMRYALNCRKCIEGAP